ncbi:MAG: THUMP domain-containing protein [Thermoplasmata archaeon]
MVILVRYAEIALKSNYVRNTLEKALIRNIEDKLIEQKIQAKIERDRGHIYITSDKQQEVQALLARTFGVVSFSPCIKCSTALEEIERNVLDVVAKVCGSRKTFAIRARRAGEFGFTSMELAKHLGAAVLGNFPNLAVNLNKPELEIHVEVRHSGAYIYTEKLAGPGGLPYGTQGRVVALVATEEDVVAAWLMMKRGCRLFCLGGEKFSRVLGEWAPVRVEGLEPSMANAIRIAKKRRALGIVSGMDAEELLKVLPEPAEFPVFLPVAGMDEAEVVRLKREIGVIG